MCIGVCAMEKQRDGSREVCVSAVQPDVQRDEKRVRKSVCVCACLPSLPPSLPPVLVQSGLYQVYFFLHHSSLRPSLHFHSTCSNQRHTVNLSFLNSKSHLQHTEAGRLNGLVHDPRLTFFLSFYLSFFLSSFFPLVITNINRCISGKYG